MKEQAASRIVYENPEVELIDIKLENVVTASCSNDIENPDPCQEHDEDV